MDFICIKRCDNKSVNTYFTDKTYFYEVGKRYTYNFVGEQSGYKKNPLYDGIKYCGYVTDAFIKQYFVPMYEYDHLLREVDNLFDEYLLEINE